MLRKNAILMLKKIIENYNILLSCSFKNLLSSIYCFVCLDVTI